MLTKETSSLIFFCCFPSSSYLNAEQPPKRINKSHILPKLTSEDPSLVSYICFIVKIILIYDIRWSFRHSLSTNNILVRYHSWNVEDWNNFGDIFMIVSFECFCYVSNWALHRVASQNMGSTAYFEFLLNYQPLVLFVKKRKLRQNFVVYDSNNI